MSETSAKHTPGPWTFQLGSVDLMDGSSDCIHIYAHRGMEIATIIQPNPVATEEANARLIAAAPELLEALKECVRSHCPDDKIFCGACTPARAAIAKAEGR